MLKIQLKRFFKIPCIPFGIVLYSLYCGYIFNQNYYVDTPDMIFQTVMMQIPVTFLFFLILSFSFFRKTNGSIREILNGSNCTCWKDYLTGIMIFVSLDLLLSVVFYSIEVSCLLQSEYEQKNAWLIMLFKAIILYHFLNYIFAILLGCIISFIRNTKRAYVVLALSYGMFADFVIRILGDYVTYHPNMKHWLSVFSVLTRDYTYVLDGYYQYSVEFVNFQRILFWIVLSIGILCAALWKRYRKIWVGITFVSTIICLFLYYQPAGFYYNDFIMCSDTDDDYYYNGLESYITGKDNHVSEADYTVEKYSGSITIDRQLEANVTVQVDKTDKKQYEFTLSHQFIVDDVQNEGKSLTFVQKGDHVTVDTPRGLEKNEITFFYAGYSECYYSTSQATYLPGFFCYIPFPGHRLVWHEQELLPDGMIQIAQRDNMYGLGYKTKYDLELNIKGNLYCNLAKKENGHYCGETDGVTILSSPFAKSIEYEGVTFVYSCYEWKEQDLKEQCKEIMDELPYKDELVGKMVIEPPYISRWNFFVGDNHLVMHIEDLESNYAEYRKDGVIPLG